jgi:hypothetical protein
VKYRKLSVESLSSKNATAHPASTGPLGAGPVIKRRVVPCLGFETDIVKSSLVRSTSAGIRCSMLNPQMFFAVALQNPTRN